MTKQAKGLAFFFAILLLSAAVNLIARFVDGEYGFFAVISIVCSVISVLAGTAGLLSLYKGARK